MIACPHCHQTSHNDDFCDNCHQILLAQSHLPLPTQIILPDGRCLDSSFWEGRWPVDCFHYRETRCEQSPCRVYALNSTWLHELESSLLHRSTLKIQGLAQLTFVPSEPGLFVVAWGLSAATRPLAITPNDPADDLARLEVVLDACDLLAGVMDPLHEAGLVWLNFDPTLLEQVGDQVQIPSLDLQVFPFGSCPAVVPISTLWSPPELCQFRGDRIGPATDVFHLSLYAYYRLAGLLPGGFPGGGLEAFQFEVPSLRIYRPGIPFGVGTILQRGLSRDPDLRYPCIDALLTDLRKALEQARGRTRFNSRLFIETGSRSTIGMTHLIQGAPNQDSHTLMSLQKDQLLAILADGVTYSRIGNGEDASSLAVETLATILPEELQAAHTMSEIDGVLRKSFLFASESILTAALESFTGDQFDPLDVMTTTAVVGYLRRNRLRIATVGDSRVYLVANGMAEQLTIDGDMRSVHLASLVPPEIIQQLGNDALALYTALGIGEITSDDDLVVNCDRSDPVFQSINLVPGDVVILCTDGLVEEGVFLEPADLVALIQQQADRSAQNLAECFVQAAEQHHRPASTFEPMGLGDDITCVVFVVREKETGD